MSHTDLQRTFVYERTENFMGKVSLWDATTGKKVIEEWPKGETTTVLGDPEKILVGCSTCPDRKLYSNMGVAGKPLNIDPVARAVFFSPDVRRMVYDKNSDLWIGDVDWRTGNILNPRQVTHVGVFNGKTSAYWTGETLLYGQYRVSLNDGSVKEAPTGWYRLEKRISPDAQVVIGANVDNQLHVYDIVNDQDVNLMDGVNIRDYLWLDARRAVMIHSNRDILLFSRDTGTATVPIAGKNLHDNFYGPSPDGRYVFVSEGGNDGREVVIDTNTWQMIPISKDLQAIAWLNRSTFLLKREAPIEKRGTWIFDLEKNTETKVSPYPWDQIVVLPKPGVFVFLANKNLWRAKLDGTELTQLTTTDREDGELWAALPPQL